MVVLVKPSKRGYFDHKQGAFEVMVWTEAGFPGEANPLFSLPGERRWTLLFSYGIALFSSRFPHHFPLWFVPVSMPVSVIFALHHSILFLITSIFFADFVISGFLSRDDEKGGYGMSISASSVTLAAWSSSPATPNTGALE